MLVPLVIYIDISVTLLRFVFYSCLFFAKIDQMLYALLQKSYIDEYMTALLEHCNFIEGDFCNHDSVQKEVSKVIWESPS